MKIINGSKLSKKVLDDIKKKIRQKNLKPKLVIISIGDDKASKIYINMKKKKGEKIGIKVDLIEKKSITTKKLIDLIQNLNKKKDVHGIILQLPVPKNIDESAVVSVIDPKKDVDGMSPISLGNLWQGKKAFAAATALSIMKCIDYTGVELEGKHAVIINRSDIIGKPLSALLLKKDCTITICHSKTKNLTKYTKNADILISGTGKPKLINSNMIKEDAIVVDAGINKSSLGISGDIDQKSFEKSKKASFLTPVPGGVGPLTVAILLKNTYKACLLSNFKNF